MTPQGENLSLRRYVGFLQSKLENPPEYVKYGTSVWKERNNRGTNSNNPLPVSFQIST